MSPLAQAWLPREVLDREDLREALSQALESWWSEWIADGPQPCIEHRRAEGAAAGVRLRDGDTCRGGRSAVDPARLLSLLLGREIDLLALATSDRAVLDTLADAAMVDLELKLSTIFGPWAEAANAPTSSLRTLLGDGRNTPCLGFFTPLDVAARYVCRNLKPARSAAPLADLTTAFSDHLVTADVMLGSAELALDELADLAVGDILPLDRPWADGLELRVRENGRLIGRAAVSAAPE